MKTNCFFGFTLIIALSLGMPSCFQDLGQDPPFDYPEQPVPTYKPIYDGEQFYFPFDENFTEQVTLTDCGVVGTPTLNDAGKIGKAYMGATDSYITFPSKDFSTSFSAVFWYQLNSTPDRGGILTVSADDAGKAATAKNNRNYGFRLFREAGNGGQTLKLNAGNGTADVWFDGGAAAVIPATGWVFVAFTISNTGCNVYINGQNVSTGTFAGVDWTGCTIMSIGSGAPYFTEWGHLSDLSLIDELRVFKKELSQSEIQTIMNAQ